MNSNLVLRKSSVTAHAESTALPVTSIPGQTVRHIRSKQSENDATALPFVKWVGGKRSLIRELVANMPDEFGNYYEPFVGGGALFFETHKQLSKAYLSDSNWDLMITYKAIQTNPYELIERLKIYESNHSDKYYYKRRSKIFYKKILKNPIEIAARFLYLNRTCYNGLYRVNRSGNFNVPMGNYDNPSIVNEQRILACSRALQSAVIQYKEFHMTKPQNGDFVYFDPPYHPTDELSFTSYTKLDFTEKDQVRLRDFALELHKTGVFIMLSNSDTKFIRNLYDQKPFIIKTVSAPRMVNCKSEKRGAVQEVLILNYQK